jgi:DnaJ-class molecular chaperone
MKKKEWEKILAAKERLSLGDRATLADIKRAYRRLSKKHHPDTKGGKEARLTKSAEFLKLTEAVPGPPGLLCRLQFPAHTRWS